MAPAIDWARFAFGTALLLYASVLDLRTRRVPNRTWLVGTAGGLLVLAVDVLVLHRLEPLYLVLVPLIVAVSYGLWYVHLIAGGADAKALMTLAVLAPYPLDLGGAFPVWPDALPPAAVAFANSLLVFLLFPLLFVLYNLARGDVRFPAMFLGYRLALDHAATSFVWIAERAGEDGAVRQVLMASRMDPEQVEANVARLRALGRTRVWVTPKIPYMVPLLGGYVAAFFLGDVLTHLVQLFLPTRA